MDWKGLLKKKAQKMADESFNQLDKHAFMACAEIALPLILAMEEIYEDPSSASTKADVALKRLRKDLD